MENDFDNEFFTVNELNDCIELPISQVVSDLTPYTKYSGLVLNGDNKLYVTGIFGFNYEEYKREIPFDENTTFDIKLTCTEFCSKPELNGAQLKATTNLLNINIIYNYSEFCQLITDLEIPLLKDKEQLSNKKYNYIPEIINRMSNFSLAEASKIAANIPLDYESPYTKSYDHFNLLISDCIIGQNQDDFKIHTKELWIEKHNELGESYCQNYDNGTYLKVSVTLSDEMTVISKSEFLRWCIYENIETGLVYEPREFEESVEQLKDKILSLEEANEKLEEENFDSFLKEPPELLDKIKELETQLSDKKKELNNLCSIEFPVMTLKLKAMLASQNKYWLDYDEESPTPQKLIAADICEYLNLKPDSNSTFNRAASELAKAIQPDHISRK